MRLYYVRVRFKREHRGQWSSRFAVMALDAAEAEALALKECQGYPDRTIAQVEIVVDETAIIAIGTTRDYGAPQ